MRLINADAILPRLKFISEVDMSQITLSLALIADKMTEDEKHD